MADAVARNYTEFKYGTELDLQFFRVHLPPGHAAGGSALPLAMVIHGGYWKNMYDIENGAADTLAPALAAAGYAAVDVEYRRRDHPAGGWPNTNGDVAAAWAHIPVAMATLKCELIPNKAVVIGHSAGGCMALWLATHTLSLRTTNPATRVPSLVVALAPITDLKAGYDKKIGDEGNAVEKYMKGSPDDIPEAYAAASPIELLPLSVPAIVAYGLKDVDVPLWQSTEYIAAGEAKQGSALTLLEFPDADHFDVANAGGGFYKTTVSAAWPKILSATKLAMRLK